MSHYINLPLKALVKLIGFVKAREVIWLVAFIVIVSAPLRLYQLNTHPPGLFGDEAADGLDALSIISGNRPLFLTENNGREPLHAYLVALSLDALGRTPVAVRLPSALASTLTVLTIFLATRAIIGTRIALIASIISGFTVWPIMLGRLATRPALLPFFLSITLWLVIEAYKRKNNKLWILAGLILGISVYTYTPIRLLIIFPILCLSALFIGQIRKRIILGTTYFYLSFMIIVSPFVIYTVNNQEQVLGRTAGVSVIDINNQPSEILNTAASQATAVFQMFSVPGKGDWNLRHNIPNRPVFDPIMTCVLLIGIAIAPRKLGKNKFALILVYSIIALLPTILSEEAPHFGRASGILPILYIFPALGVSWIYKQLNKFTASFTSILISSAIICGSILITIHDYYLDDYLSQPNTGFWFDEQCTIAATDINKFISAGWQGNNTQNANLEYQTSDKIVFIAPNVCPQYSSSGYYTVQFLVPMYLGSTPPFQRYSLDSLPDHNSLANNLLFLGIPGDEDILVPWLEEDYNISIQDGPWTPSDNLGNSWLVYRSLYATAK
ncbi:MAG: glycosyltransferase family 39 protein [Anaerolineales bacterium]|nr:glycosyltransferase family 39 protein [Anaerolineales bacterium]